MTENNYTEALMNLSREALDNLPFGAYVIDKNGIILFFNQNMVKMSGVEDAKKIEGQNVFEVPSYKKYGLLDFIKRGLGGKSFRLKGIQYISHIGKRESYRDYYGIPIKSEGGEVEKLLCIVEDVTQRKILEEQVVAEIEEKEKIIKEIRKRVDVDMEKINEVLTNTKGFLTEKK
ncbi:hypothetical protein C0583_02900 [Candidatus Parcubacteria bacterium]|nr:MAG: hypothetical protein C0583_02900 [Candidatus Parcubacteria bacterium]